MRCELVSEVYKERLSTPLFYMCRKFYMCRNFVSFDVTYGLLPHRDSRVPDHHLFIARDVARRSVAN